MASHSTSAGEAGGTVLRAFLSGCGLDVGAESATVAALAEAFSQQGLKSPEDLGALASKGTLSRAHRELLLRQVGPGGASCWMKLCAAAGPFFCHGRKGLRGTAVLCQRYSL